MLLQPLEVVLQAISWLTTIHGQGTVGVLGILSHRLYFIRGEHHLKAPLYFGLWALASVFVVSIFHAANAFEPLHGNVRTDINAFEALARLNAAFFLPLFTSMVVYRLLEHPLRHFPGPRLLATSKLWHVSYMFTKKNHLFLDDLYHKYGSIVRTGPQELTVVDPEVWQVIGGPGTSCIKGPWYDLMYPYMSLTSLRTKHGYAPRRKRWDEAFGFSTNSYVGDKGHRVHATAKLLLNQLYKCAGSPINVNIWFHHFAFDIMGDLAWGRSFNLVADLTSGSKPHFAPAIITQATSMFQYFTPATWMGHICFYLACYVPFVTQKWNRIFGWAAEICDERLERGGLEAGDKGEAGTDAFSRFILSARRDGDDESLDRLALYGETFAIGVAGTHTTAAALTMMLYELAQRPEMQDELRREIAVAGVVSDGDADGRKEEVDAAALERLPFLDACINETMRFYAPIPSGGARQTTEKGVKVGDTWIPPNTIIIAPRYSISRLEAAWEKPNEFIPERWTTKPDMIRDRRAFNAFGIGRHTCPGKALGMLEVRMVAAMILANFELTLAPTKGNKTRVVDEAKDAFLTLPGELELIFTPLRES
ncbi:Uu.00g069140.m01.CDS01 [Anthostomella pinea]|uniref:Uu.00g069140.m01.CDS01 n=1 Tax=Anthostomella pinea TaxID=933095 RepID=A0AAI8VUH1_9PEZI|nr:Uu.00g069140.m01.CDS01 [Anthostomella pinea]